MTPAPTDSIQDFWATTFLAYVPDQAVDHLDTLAMQAISADANTILTSQDGASIWLSSEINSAARAYLDRWAEAEVNQFKLIGEAVTHEFGDYEPLTNHPDAYLSGIFYVTVPKDRRELQQRDDANSNAISFADPRFAMNMNAIAGDPYVNWQKTLQPDPGLMIIWPSFIDFFIHPNLSENKQISIQFKIRIGSG